MRPGDRVVVALPPGVAFAVAALAAEHAGVTLAPLAPDADVDEAADALDACLAVREHDGVFTTGSWRAPRTAPTPDVRFLVQTSGTAGARRWVALSHDNVRAVLDSHAPRLALAGATVLSVLPWHHVFGLVMQLLPALAAGATLVRERSAGRDSASVVAAGEAHAVTHLDAVPYTVRRLAERADGLALLTRLRGGVIGGAPVDAALAAVRATTQLRVGYGQTEASPGICLGDPGEWRAGFLGRPLGCDARVDDDGVLAFRGPNACVGTWEGGALHRLAPDRWARTGDLARPEADGSYTFEGRLADSFKLANGRHVAAAAIERAVCATFPRVREALLSSPDGDTLVLAVSGDGPPPDAAAVAPLLGGLAARPLRVVPVTPDAWVRTPKGELDRRHPTGGSG